MLRLAIFACALVLCACARVRRADTVETLLVQHDKRLQNLELTLLTKLSSIETTLAELNSKVKKSCQSGYELVGESCYKFFSGNAQWAAAQKRCAADGAHLVAIETAEEMQLIKSLLKSNGIGDKTVWTGGHKVNGEYVWDGTNQPFTYTYWDSNKPFGSECVFMHYERFAYKWNDGSCTYGNRPYICEI